MHMNQVCEGMAEGAAPGPRRHMILKGMAEMDVNECIDFVIGGGLFYAIDNIMDAMCAVRGAPS